jgi:hypothetical protein
VELSRILGGGGGIGFRRFAAAYAFSLVPIAIAYQVAHYYTYLLIQGQMIVSYQVRLNSFVCYATRGHQW